MRENLDNEHANCGASLNPASFKEFMDTFHNQDQEEVPLTGFQVPADMKRGIERSIRTLRVNK